MEIKTENKARKWKIICENCKEKFEVKLEDLTKVANFQSYDLYSCNCPFCGKKDYVRDSKF